MMPFDSKLEFQNENAVESQLDLHNSSPQITMPFNSIVPIKTSLKIKAENGGICAERENSNDSQSSCKNCQNLQQKLKISRGWNRFYKEKVINVDKVLHIITEFEREKQKNLELQLAYDQRSREWSQQQEQLINLLTEVQPLREKLKIAEATLDRETKERQKHQYMEESLKVTIQQLQAKVSHMNTIANPVFVENLEKKLNTSRSEIKKVKCNLEFKKGIF
ncbi:hypothetical protein Anas_02254 [Armadillidium nasatum]|uniref:Uncharacterized protein n=1 Tax=Armadillidium nasatum TaxID=96803 RepID=A0A5N5SRD5_9CRUS|nr:hypothetical protein Anas_02254 [Armadillidium nasatum]